ncbi:TetR/AcrR family transcriptional regulator [Maribellus comscasis]|nr:TetR/AcrR family transcriptional regulator [Maribellus comscasis]
MARITDKNRIERLKQSTMKLVVERGFGGASASLIAKDANVASGYFYMHYKGKYEMVNALLHDVYQEVVQKFEELTSLDSTFTSIVENMIRHFFTMANTDPNKLKFLYVLMNDYSFVIDKKLHDDIFKILNILVYDGHSSGQLDKEISQSDLYLIVVINTIQYINQHYKNSNKRVVFRKEDEDHLIYLTNKILKEPGK